MFAEGDRESDYDTCMNKVKRYCRVYSNVYGLWLHQIYQQEYNAFVHFRMATEQWDIRHNQGSGLRPQIVLFRHRNHETFQHVFQDDVHGFADQAFEQTDSSS